MCCTMLLGVTFAWLTDSVVTTNNLIVAGNLDVEMYYAKAVDANGNVITDVSKLDWQVVEKDTNVFGDNLWEPGYTDLTYFKVENKGEMALKYKLYVDIVSETAGVNVYGDEFYLSRLLKGHITDKSTVDAAGTTLLANDRDYYKSKLYGGTSLPMGWPLVENYYNIENGVVLATGESTKPIAMSIWMPETVGNEANAGYVEENGSLVYKPASLQLGITLVAAQAEAEDDAFGTDYDRFSHYGVRNDVAITDTAADLVVTNDKAAQNLLIGKAPELTTYDSLTYTGTLEEVTLKAVGTVAVKGDLKVVPTVTDADYAADATIEIIGFQVSGSIIVEGYDVDNIVVRDCKAGNIQVGKFSVRENSILATQTPAIAIDRCEIVGAATATGNAQYGIFADVGVQGAKKQAYKLSVTNCSFTGILADAIKVDAHGATCDDAKGFNIELANNRFVSYGLAAANGAVYAAINVHGDANLSGFNTAGGRALVQAVTDAANGNVLPALNAPIYAATIEKVNQDLSVFIESSNG